MTPARRPTGRALETIEGIRTIAARALSAGGSFRRLTEVQWDISGRCERPVTIQLTGRSTDRRPVHRHTEWRDRSGNLTYVGPARVGKARPVSSLAVTMDVRCRRCEACGRTRRWQWSTRAILETQKAEATWFGTLTLRPSAYVQCEYRAQHEFSEGRTTHDQDGVVKWVNKRAGTADDWYSLPEAERATRVERIIYREVSAMIKRWRKRCGRGLRFLAVFERRNKKGAPFTHVHMLVHGNASMRWDDLVWREGNRLSRKMEWSHGYVTWTKLNTEKDSPRYVTKYIAKDGALIVASQNYGRESYDEAQRSCETLSEHAQPGEPSPVASDPVRDGCDGTLVTVGAASRGPPLPALDFRPAPLGGPRAAAPPTSRDSTPSELAGNASAKRSEAELYCEARRSYLGFRRQGEERLDCLWRDPGG